MDRGYFKMWRMWFDDDSPIWPNESLVMIMVWCCKKATHKKRVVQFKTGKGEVGVSLKPGQLIFGRHKAAKQLGMNPETVRKRIKKLTDLGYITMQSTSQYSILTISHYNELKNADLIANTNQVPTKYQPSTTKKTLKTLDNLDNKDKRILLTDDYEFENITEELKEKWSNAFPAVDIDQQILRAASWVEANPKNKKKDYERFLFNWLSRAQDRAPRLNAHVEKSRNPNGQDGQDEQFKIALRSVKEIFDVLINPEHEKYNYWLEELNKVKNMQDYISWDNRFALWREQ